MDLRKVAIYGQRISPGSVLQRQTKHCSPLLFVSPVKAFEFLFHNNPVMFEPTIKYKSVVADKDGAKDEQKPTENSRSTTELSVNDSSDKETETTLQPSSSTITTTLKKSNFSFSFEEEEEVDSDYKIEVDSKDKERIIVTLSTGRQYAADRYCPHAGADLSIHGKVSEHDYPPEIGPVLMCSIHYWEFALEKAGRGAGGGGWATLNASCLNAHGSPPCTSETKGELCSKGSVLDW